MKFKKMLAVIVAEGRAAQHGAAKKIAEEMLTEVEKALTAVGLADFDVTTNLSAVDKVLSLAEVKLDSLVAAKGLLEASVAPQLVSKMLVLQAEVARLESLRRRQLFENFKAENAIKDNSKGGKKAKK